MLPGSNVCVAYVDDEFSGLIPLERQGVMLAPRRHTGMTSESPERAAAILATLRLLVEAVKSSYHVEAATIEPTTDLPAAPGHVCYQVTPVFPRGEGEVRVDAEARARDLASLLSHRASGLRGRR